MSANGPIIDATLRRTRSTGDINRTSIHHAERIRIPQRSRYSESHTDSRERMQFSSATQESNYVTQPSPVHLAPHSAGSTAGRIWSPPPVVVQQMEEAQAQHQGTAPQQNRPQRQHNLSLYSRTLAFFGYGRGASHARRLLVSLLWNLGLGFAQIVVIITLLVVAAHRHSPTVPSLSEWQACARPLGVWCCLWIIRVCLACILAYWGWTRDRDARANHTDAESTSTQTIGTTARHPGTQPTTARTRRNPRTSPDTPQENNTPESTALPRSPLYTRLSLLSSLLTLSWFLTAHILEYTSINSCRLSSPHLWWLVFGILCIMYLMVLEVVILGFVVFIIAPILFLFWNILLICLGRHPLQNPTMIKPDIGKLPKTMVDRIPLVMYIPPPPDEPIKTPITVPDNIYSYPPKPHQSKSNTPKRRFYFLRVHRKKNASGKSGGEPSNKMNNGSNTGSETPPTWEDNWEPSDYPFVRLEGNRAACAICLMDFEEPKRVMPTPNASIPQDEVSSNTTLPQQDQNQEEKLDSPPVPSGEVQEIFVEPLEDSDQLRLTDAGDGAQPLRLLACGHVFHKTCLDPWLTDVSGRCPVCQRPVEIPLQTKKKRRRRQS